VFSLVLGVVLLTWVVLLTVKQQRVTVGELRLLTERDTIPQLGAQF